jgi:hypothetical protein
MFPFREISCDLGVIFEGILRIGKVSASWIGSIPKKEAM